MKKEEGRAPDYIQERMGQSRRRLSYGMTLNLLMFCRVITAQVDYIIALVKDNYMMQVDKTLYRRVSH